MDRADFLAIVNKAILKERKRCVKILQAARFGTIDNDVRSLIHRVESGDPAPSDE